MRKWILVLLLLGVTLVDFAAFAAGQAEGSKAIPKEIVGTIRQAVWVSSTLLDYNQKLVEQFKKVQPNVKKSEQVSRRCCTTKPSSTRSASSID
ncbi:MAG: hypothetical protein AB1798_09010 [Spirochaetota bacterium]